GAPRPGAGAGAHDPGGLAGPEARLPGRGAADRAQPPRALGGHGLPRPARGGGDPLRCTDREHRGRLRRADEPAQLPAGVRPRGGDRADGAGRGAGVRPAALRRLPGHRPARRPGFLSPRFPPAATDAAASRPGAAASRVPGEWRGPRRRRNFARALVYRGAFPSLRTRAGPTPLLCSRSRRVGVLLLLLLAALPLAAQPGPDGAEPGSELTVYVMTCGPGDIACERFGHNAIWIHDAADGPDVAYNYGLFDFDQENFFL